MAFFGWVIVRPRTCNSFRLKRVSPFCPPLLLFIISFLRDPSLEAFYEIMRNGACIPSIFSAASGRHSVRPFSLPSLLPIIWYRSTLHGISILRRPPPRVPCRPPSNFTLLPIPFFPGGRIAFPVFFFFHTSGLDGHIKQLQPDAKTPQPILTSTGLLQLFFFFSISLTCS